MKKKLSCLIALTSILVSCTDNLLNSFDNLKKQQNFAEGTSMPLSSTSELDCPICTPPTGEVDNNGNPVGGGPGYDQMISPHQADYTVTTLADLKTALNTAQPGNIIFLPDTVVLEITDPEDFNLPLNEGVTLASNRGSYGCGAIITTGLYGIITQCPTCQHSDWISELDAKKGRHIFQVQGNNVRVTGIRFFGPSTAVGNSIQMKGKKCIESNGFNNLLIDNNEFKGWPYEAIAISQNSSSGIVIKNNYIHHNIQDGFGYGIAFYGTNTFAICKGNYFAYNRHDITNEGRPNSGYEASYNVVEGGGTSHNFDTHGGCEYDATGEEAIKAGAFYHIHNNLFYSNGNANIAIRGIPEVMCLIEKNRFAKAPNQNIIRQRQENGNCQAVFNENVFAWNNVYNYTSQGNYAGYYVSRAWQDRASSCYLPESFDHSMMDFAIGDLNGNNITDLIISKNNTWKQIEYPNEEKFLNQFNINDFNWTTILSTPYSIHQATFDDFTGDGITDAFIMDGTNWHLSAGAQASFVPINTSGYIKNDISIGDFDGDSKADVFKANGIVWSISKGGATGWIDINSSGLTLSDMRFGFFNANNKFDVFKTNQVNWSYSDGGSTSWIDINSSGELLNNLIFADINKDGLTDVLVKYNHYHKVSWGGQSGWTDLTYNALPAILNVW